MRAIIRKPIIIIGLVLFFGFDEFALIFLFFKIGFPHLSLPIWIAIAVVMAVLNVLLALVVFRVLQTRPTTGVEGLVGLKGAVQSWQGKQGKVFLRGEGWDAESTEELGPGDEVVVSATRGLVLLVRPTTRSATTNTEI